MLFQRDKLFCEISPTTYAISLQKEILKRHIQNARSKERFASQKQTEKLANLVSSHDNGLIKRGRGIDPVLQENKAVNIDLACRQLNGLLIRPGETFSFWRVVGKTTKRKGYLDGRVIVGGKLQPGLGGGLCNLGNTIHLLVLHSPMTVTEFHSHSDALAPDHGKRVPFSSGTSVSYNNIDYRFRNDTDQTVQLCLWCENERLYGELRSERAFPWRYALVEEDHHFQKEGNKYYRVSRIYCERLDAETGAFIDRELVLDNHSEVMFDYDLIPPDQIRPAEK
ncbi:MAG: VanW family protein [Oscillospiraceae bacterium]|nr:VanW family protein [Oscillospiraceae bacterium]MBQ9046203.1 VanW family protein [Oscillospiraceae bacterium]MBQ9719873.1 VanW family protein [Oscillospiraceae bacterium]